MCHPTPKREILKEDSSLWFMSLYERLIACLTHSPHAIHRLYINTPTATATIASTSKNGNSDGIIAFRAPSSARGKVTLRPSATFDGCKLLILSNKKRNRQEIKKNEEILEKQPRSNRNKI